MLFCSRSFCTNTVTLLCKTSIFRLYSASGLIQSTLTMRFLATILLSDVCVPPGRTPLVTIRHRLSYYFCDFMTSLCLPQRRQWHPTPVLLPGKSHGQRRLVGCSPWGRYSRTWLSDFTFTFHFHALEKEMATHSSVLAWRIPGMGEPDGLPSMGSHRVGHDWSDLAAAAAAAMPFYIWMTCVLWLIVTLLLS